MRFYYTPPLYLIRILSLKNIAFLSALAFLICYLSISGVAQIITSLKTYQETELTPDLEQISKTQKPDLMLDITPPPHSWKKVQVSHGDTLAKILSRTGVNETTLHNIIKANPTSNTLTNIFPGQTIEILLSSDDNLKALKLPVSQAKNLHIIHTEKGYRFNFEEKEITKKLAYRHGTISGSLYSSAIQIGISHKIINQLTDIFGWDIDFALDLRDNDEFEILLEEEFIDNERVDFGNIIAAKFKNQGKTYKALRYTDPQGRSGYFSPEGYSLQKAFLRTPVKFTRISSHFSLARRHPILHQIRAHKGVDYAAPHGTPIKAAGDGKVSFIGTKSGYGKTIEIQHGSKYSTLYAHLSSYTNNLRVHKSVRQGEVIGFVGQTGLATSTHLHYEFRVDGEHRDPLTVKLPRSHPIALEHRKEFLELASQTLEYMQEQHATMVAKNNGS